MNAAIFVVEFASFCFAIVNGLARAVRTVLSSIAIMTLLCSILSILCVGAMLAGLPIPAPTPLVLAGLSLALLVRSVRDSVEETRPLVITVEAPAALPVIGTAEPSEEIQDIAGSYPMVDRFAEPAPVAQDAASEAPVKKATRKPVKSRKPVVSIVEDLDSMPQGELIVLARSAGVKGVSTRWGTATLAKRIREARAAVS